MATVYDPVVFEERFNGIKTDMGADSMSIVHERLPEKITGLTDLYKKLRREFSAGDFEQPSIPPRDSETILPCNERIRSLTPVMKGEISQLVYMLNTLRVWVRLHIPRMEDGNNFGVEVQQEILGMINSGRSTGVQVMETITNYHFKRGRLCALAQKHPGCIDYRVSISELDMKQYRSMVQNCMNLRDSYLLLHDRITKNLDKLSNPRSSLSRTGYGMTM